jgi:UDP-hydrolysing UDP-N-acetyl-D-glucosamine 2-epimerase
MRKRRIAIVTGTRAEYGLLYWTMKELRSRGADLHIIVTGAHLSPRHGMTVKQIEEDGWDIAAKVDIGLADDTPIALTQYMAHALSGIATAFTDIRPDITVVLGDRYEILAAACASAMLHIPIAHIHGGEETEGALDNSWRHAITKMATWHFPPYELAKRRILQMGEAPERVFLSGAPGIDNIALLDLLSQESLAQDLKINLISPVILCTYHPEELSLLAPHKQINAVIAALEQFPDSTLLITGANADSGGQEINTLLQDFAKQRPGTVFRLSFGSRLYLSAMKHCDVVVGNSSSALLEAPVLGKATVNIGTRQAGRLRTPSVIDCSCETSSIVSAIRTALSAEFQHTLAPSTVFGVPGTVHKLIGKVLMEEPLPVSLQKRFQLY